MKDFQVTLQHPFEVRGTSYTELTVRRPLVRDLIAADRQPGVIGSNAALLATCAGLSVADIGHMDAADFRAILAQGATLGFFPREDGSGVSGETSSS